MSKVVAEADRPPQRLADKTILHLLHYKSGAKVGEGTLIAPGDKDEVHCRRDALETDKDKIRTQMQAWLGEQSGEANEDRTKCRLDSVLMDLGATNKLRPVSCVAPESTAAAFGRMYQSRRT